jgi:hypothetical protein
MIQLGQEQIFNHIQQLYHNSSTYNSSGFCTHWHNYGVNVIMSLWFSSINIPDRKEETGREFIFLNIL